MCCSWSHSQTSHTRKSRRHWTSSTARSHRGCALPADPDRLKALLKRRFTNPGDTEHLTEKVTGDSWLFSVARDIILDMPVTPQVRAAAFRMIADLRTVRSVGRTRDVQGRTGIAVALDERTSDGLFQHRLIINPATGRALGYEKILVKPAGTNADRPAGFREVAVSVLTAEWTGTAPE